MSALRIERDGHVLRVTIARPERRNAFDAELIRELTDAFSEVGDARAVVLTGEGESFCAGADIEWQRSSIDLSYEENVEDALRLYEMLVAVDGCPAPVVAWIQGYCLGGGCGLAACADVAIADEGATFGFSEVKLGIIPAVISPFVLARIGPGAARRYVLTGERFGPEAALRIGLVSEIAPNADHVVAELLGSGPAAVREAKQLVRPDPGDGHALAELAARMRTSDEGQDGLRAFLERRKPGWTD
jgi:enoyl-CoA hydratase/carnithine racemase